MAKKRASSKIKNVEEAGELAAAGITMPAAVLVTDTSKLAPGTKIDQPQFLFRDEVVEPAGFENDLDAMEAHVGGCMHTHMPIIPGYGNIARTVMEEYRKGNFDFAKTKEGEAARANVLDLINADPDDFFARKLPKQRELLAPDDDRLVQGPSYLAHCYNPKDPENPVLAARKNPWYSLSACARQLEVIEHHEAFADIETATRIYKERLAELYAQLQTSV